MRTGGVSDPIWPSFSEENYVLSLYSSNSSSLESEKSMKMETGRLEQHLPTVQFWLQDFSEIRKKENYEEPICEQEENFIVSTNSPITNVSTSTPKKAKTTTVTSTQDEITTIDEITTKNSHSTYESSTTPKNITTTTVTPQEISITTINEFSNSMTTPIRTTAKTLIVTNASDSASILKFSYIIFLKLLI